jgi:hypothetical protein
MCAVIFGTLTIPLIYMFAGVPAIYWCCLQSGLAKVKLLGAGARRF